ncbi:hypothetical protein [Actinoallomurus rhizosphaericola]|uniref:hypothetical protein n=1 Tax=Actinoallomurus rhizosphaericola TaxID=2952536 RepID=UPI0020904418|nr:hypothetical protein [Actinoallomurus rhizosphaericola]MCO5994295.1 hypothetical protein [Actinoallomurus rhizosphaericola]
MTGRVLIGITAWAAAAAVSTGIGIAAISVLGAGITDRGVRPLTPDQVDRALAAGTTPAPATTTPATPTAPAATPTAPAATPTSQGTSGAPAAGTTRALSAPGGSVLARCGPADAVYLLSWTPAQGYGVDDVNRGPASRASVKLEADHGRKLVIQVTCRSGVPTAVTTNGGRHD